VRDMSPGFEIYAPHGTEGPGNLLDTVSTCILHARGGQFEPYTL
jgi:hypothetical protein